MHVMFHGLENKSLRIPERLVSWCIMVSRCPGVLWCPGVYHGVPGTWCIMVSRGVMVYHVLVYVLCPDDLVSLCIMVYHGVYYTLYNVLTARCPGVLWCIMS